MSAIESATITSPELIKKIPLVECFGPTVQGEGPATGMITYFLRFGLCDFRCTQCDSMHAVDPKIVQANARWLTQDEIFQELRSAKAKHPASVKRVVLSGGNPAIHDLKRLVTLLHDSYWDVHVETQGSVWRPWLAMADQLVVSPKGPGMGVVHDIADLDKFFDALYHSPPVKFALKIPIFDQRDIEFAVQLSTRYPRFNNRAELYLSLGNPYPPGYKYEHFPENLALNLLDHYKLLLEDVMLEPELRHARFTPQMHVLLWGNKHGV